VKIFNPLGNDHPDTLELWGGSNTGLIYLNNAKYKWATNLYQTMRNNFWQPHKVDLTEDKNQYRKLTPAEQRAYKALISYLTF
jgi:ribonucleoside-diphosphate reductase beta chain